MILASTISATIACAAIFKPVCANGKEFGNECEAKAAGITSFTNGKCGEVGCAAVLKSVCANGKDFDSECQAKEAGFTTWTDGKCKDESTFSSGSKSSVTYMAVVGMVAFISQ